MTAVDQVGNLGGAKNMYVHGGEDTNRRKRHGDIHWRGHGGAFGQRRKGVRHSGELGGGGGWGDFLAAHATELGYDDAIVASALHHSHLDSTVKDATASAAMLTARLAIAAAYQNKNAEVNTKTAAAYALQLIPNAVDSSSETFINLYACLFENGNCIHRSSRHGL